MVQLRSVFNHTNINMNPYYKKPKKEQFVIYMRLYNYKENFFKFRNLSSWES